MPVAKKEQVPRLSSAGLAKIRSTVTWSQTAPFEGVFPHLDVACSDMEGQPWELLWLLISAWPVVLKLWVAKFICICSLQQNPQIFLILLRWFLPFAGLTVFWLLFSPGLRISSAFPSSLLHCNISGYNQRNRCCLKTKKTPAFFSCVLQGKALSEFPSISDFET